MCDNIGFAGFKNYYNKKGTNRYNIKDAISYNKTISASISNGLDVSISNAVSYLWLICNKDHVCAVGVKCEMVACGFVESALPYLLVRVSVPSQSL